MHTVKSFTFKQGLLADKTNINAFHNINKMSNPLEINVIESDCLKLLIMTDPIKIDLEIQKCHNIFAYSYNNMLRQLKSKENLTIFLQRYSFFLIQIFYVMISESNYIQNYKSQKQYNCEICRYIYTVFCRQIQCTYYLTSLYL